MLLSYQDYLRAPQIVVQGTVLMETTFKPVPDACIHTISDAEETWTDQQGHFEFITGDAMPIAVVIEHPDFETMVVKMTSLPATQAIKLKRKSLLGDWLNQD